MKHIAKAPLARLLIILLFTGITSGSFSSLSSAVTPGEHYGEGIVFYVDGTGKHGLIAALSDMPGHSKNCPEKNFNWNDAIAVCNTLGPTYMYGNNALMSCPKQMIWFLPNQEQLHQLYLHKSIVDGLTDNIYWSSSESSAVGAWNQYFSDGSQCLSNKAVLGRVRAVRVF